MPHIDHNCVYHRYRLGGPGAIHAHDFVVGNTPVSAADYPAGLFTMFPWHIGFSR